MARDSIVILVSLPVFPIFSNMTNHERRQSLASSLRSQNGMMSTSGSNGGNSDAEILKKKTRTRRTILQKEYDEFNLKRMSVDGSSSRGRGSDGPVGEGQYGENIDGYEMASFDSQLVASLSSSPDPPPSTSVVTDRTPKQQLESWKDFDYPDYEDRFEFEAVNRLSNYNCQEEESIWRSSRWCHCNTFRLICSRSVHGNSCDKTAMRRSTSILFVISIVVISAAMIGLAIPHYQIANVNSNSSTIHATTFHDSKGYGAMEQHLNPATSSKYKPIQSNSQERGSGNNIDEYTPQQLLELAEDVVKSCDPETITKTDERKMCQKLCFDRMCCFDPGKYGCAQKEEKMCTVYVGCQVLYGYEYEMMISNFNNNDSERQAGIDYDGENVANNYNKSSSISDEAAMTSNTGDLLQLADKIIQYCDEYLKDHNSPSGQKCIDICREHICCFEDAGSGIACNEEKGSDFLCQVYEGCEIVVGVSELEAKM
ncbi:hypothetical protein ACHAWX_001672 [Stephanocyclus meneghinianus]